MGHWDSVLFLILCRIQAYSAVFRAIRQEHGMHNDDPMAVITRDAPLLSSETAVKIIREHYGLDVTVSTLISERDQNLRLQCTDGAEYVFKIANAAEPAEVTDFQIQALIHISAAVKQHDIPVTSPEVLLTTDGSTHITLDTPGGRHIARVVSYLQGIPLGERIASPQLARNLGRYLAHLGRALSGFSHPGSQQSLLWDLQQALGLRPLTQYIAEPLAAKAVTAALDDFERYVEPVLQSLRAQVIHSDLNPDNVLINSATGDTVVGVIDFGDMLQAPLIVDVAIGASYLRVPDGDPLRLIAEFVAGYHSVVSLETDEIEILFELIQVRLCASIAILDWRAAMRGADDPYLGKMLEGAAPAGRFLRRLREVPRANARQILNQVCASAG